MITLFAKNPTVQSHSHSPKNPNSRFLSGKGVRLTRLVISNQVKWCDIIVCCTSITQMLENFMRFFYSFQIHASSPKSHSIGYTPSTTHLDITPWYNDLQITQDLSFENLNTQPKSAGLICTDMSILFPNSLLSNAIHRLPSCYI